MTSKSCKCVVRVNMQVLYWSYYCTHVMLHSELYKAIRINSCAVSACACGSISAHVYKCVFVHFHEIHRVCVCVCDVKRESGCTALTSTHQIT